MFHRLCQGVLPEPRSADRRVRAFPIRQQLKPILAIGLRADMAVRAPFSIGQHALHQVLWVWLACAGPVAPTWAGADGEKPLTPALSPSDGARVKTGPGEERESEPPYRVTRWTVENGLPQNNIKALAQTRDGYLWLGTLKGWPGSMA